MLLRANRALILMLIVAGLASERAFAVLVGNSINPPPQVGAVSFGNSPGDDTGVQNNTTVHTLSINGNSSWIGSNFYGLFNTGGNAIDTGGFTVNNGSTVYGGTAGIQNMAGATISASIGSPITVDNGTVGRLGALYSTNGIYNDGTITGSTSVPTISNLGTGLITGSNAGILNSATGTISNTSSGNLIENGFGATIGGSSSTYGILNQGAMRAGTGAAINNQATITGTTAGLYNDVTGTISSGSTFFTIRNLNTIGGTPSQYAIYNAGTISNSTTGDVINNRGTIGGVGTTYGIYNNGSITAEDGGIAIWNNGDRISGTTASLYNNTGATISSTGVRTVANDSTIGGGASQYGIYNLGTITNTSGTGSAISNSIAGFSLIQGSIDGIYNGATGGISSTGAGIAIDNVAFI